MNIKYKFFLAFNISIILLLTPLRAYAIFGADEYRIEKFCESELKSPRQTLVYIDDQILVKDETQWAKDLLVKLTANLMPSESVTLIKLSTGTGETHELWKGCYPNYTELEFEKIKKNNNSFFGGDPVKQLKYQQAIFRKQLGDSLGKLLNENGRLRENVQFNFLSPPKKQIIRALSNDGARFDTNQGAIRIIIYSDMIENSDLGSSLKSIMPEKTDNFVLNFKDSLFYIYGIGSTILDKGVETDNIKSYWKKFLNSSEGHLMGFSSNLIIPNTTPVNKKTYDIEIAIDKENDVRLGKLQFFVDRENHIQDGYISIAHKNLSILQDGIFQCNETKCTLSAKVQTSVITKQGENELKLIGSIDNLKGSILIPNAKLPNGKNAIFEISANLVK